MYLYAPPSYIFIYIHMHLMDSLSFIYGRTQYKLTNKQVSFKFGKLSILLIFWISRHDDASLPGGLDCGLDNGP